MLKKYFPKSLYARVLLIVILPIFLMQSVVTYVFFDRHWELVSANLSANVAGQIAHITREYRQTADAARRQAIEEASARDLQINVRFESGGVIPDEDKISIFAIHSATLRRQLDDRLTEDFWFNTSSWPAYVEVRVQIDDGYLVFLPRRDRVFATTGPIFVLWLIGATLLLGWIAVVFMRNQVRSILRLAQAAEAFGRGRDAPGFRPTGATEVRRAGLAFIAMRERIKRHMHQRTAMLAGVSHDLRTPLTRIKLALALQPDNADIEALRSDVLEMERMVESYLNFARDISSDEEPQPVDIGALVREIGEDARRAGAEIEIAAEAELVVTAQRDALKRAVANLVDNARKYAGQAWLSARRVGPCVEVLVEDDGPGIPADKIEEVFRPFARLDEARNLNRSGVGLGLSVVRDVARSHGGDVTLAPSSRGGLEALLRLPA